MGEIHVACAWGRAILIQLVGKPTGTGNVGPRDMFVARLERLALLAQANMDNVAINHETGPR